MKMMMFSGLFLLFSIADGTAQLLGFQKITNEISLYQNFLDTNENAGQTLQIISINQIRLKWWFQVELTADFNRNFTLPNYKRDYYLEAGILKWLTPGIAVNYQRIHTTFRPWPTNQVGIRLSL